MRCVEGTAISMGISAGGCASFERRLRLAFTECRANPPQEGSVARFGGTKLGRDIFAGRCSAFLSLVLRF